MKILHENKSNNSRIIKDWDGDIIFEIDPPLRLNNKISFNVNYLPENSLAWFCHVVGDQIKHEILLADAMSKGELQYQLRELLGIDQMK